MLIWAVELSGTETEYQLEHQLTFQVSDFQWNEDKSRQLNGVD